MTRRLSLLALPALALAACTSAPQAPSTSLNTPAYIRAVGLLQTQSKDPAPEVRTNCIEALQFSRDPRAMEVIESGLHDDAWVVRFAAAMASGKRKARTVIPTLEALAVSDRNGSVRAASIFALKQVGRSEHMSDLGQLLHSPDPSTRANTALVLGTLGDSSAIPLLMEMRGEPDIRARFEVTAALARLGDERAQQVIISGAINKIAEDQFNAMIVCADLPPALSESPLLVGLQPIAPGVHVDPAVENLTTLRRLVAARSLARQRNGIGSAVAIENLRNKEPGLRSLALLALGEMLTREQVSSIVPYLNDPDDSVKRAAAAAIVNVFVRAEAA